MERDGHNQRTVLPPSDTGEPATLSSREPRSPCTQWLWESCCRLRCHMVTGVGHICTPPGTHRSQALRRDAGFQHKSHRLHRQCGHREPPLSVLRPGEHPDTGPRPTPPAGPSTNSSLGPAVLTLHAAHNREVSVSWAVMLCLGN